MRTTTISIITLAILLGGSVQAQPTPSKITVGIYAPTVEFGTATARLAYVQALAAAIAGNTKLEVEGQSYANLAALRSANVDFAIIDGPCYAAAPAGKLLASAVIGGATTRAWALFSGAGADMKSLRGSKLAFIQSGCNDAGFVDNAMFDSDVDPNFFGARLGKADLTAAVAEVASYKNAQAVVAPTSASKGLTKIFDTGSVPNPAFVDLSGKLAAPMVEKVAAAVIAYGGGGAIAAWSRPAREIYTALAGRLGRNPKLPILVAPEPVRMDSRDVLVDPPTLKDAASVSIRHHFVRSAERMD
ncbi:MAG: hypothetical protein KIT31_38605 [Deltaproteobacteria bacterium]|nr:hypothetical protein [Deltaproteobacteria bacterium]